MRCTNEPSLLEKASLRFDDRKSCCEGVFGYVTNCPARDVCGAWDGLSSTMGRPTRRPTPPPTTALTPPPTELTTLYPTLYPTDRPAPTPTTQLPTSSPAEPTCGDITVAKRCKRDGRCAWTEGGTCVPLSEAPPDPDPCDDMPWHPVPGGDGTCTNSLDYPMVWNYGPYSTEYFFDSAEACCAGLYGDGECVMVDACRQ